MTVSRLFALWTVAWGVAACGDDTIGAPPPVGALRFINAVADTGSMDFRVIDIVGNAPQFLDNTFRAATPYQAVEAGSRHLKVFMSPVRTDTIAGSPTMWDTTITIVAGTNYTVVMTGFARTASSPGLQMQIMQDDPTAPAAGEIRLRTVNLGSGLGAIDAFLRRGTEAPPGASLGTNLGFGTASPYAAFTAGSMTGIGASATGVPVPALFQTAGPPGQAGTPSANPIGGLFVAGSVLTGIVVPPSVVGSRAPQGGSPDSLAVETVTRSNDTVTVQSGSISRRVNRPDTVVVDTIITISGPDVDTTVVVDTVSQADSTVGTTGTGASSGVVVGNVVRVSGATEAEYNGWQVAIGPANTFSCAPTNPADTATKCAATNAIATTVFRFRYRLAGTPASPATGTPVYRIYLPTTADFTNPAVLYLVDRRPPMTVP